MTVRNVIDRIVNGYALLQLTNNENHSIELFSSLQEIHRLGKEPNICHYEIVKTGKLSMYDPFSETELTLLLESICHSVQNGSGKIKVSVSDVIALNVNGIVNFYYVDSVGFQHLLNFE